MAQTRGIVDLDVLLDALTPKVRTSLQQILKTGAYFVGQPTVPQLNQLAHVPEPGLQPERRSSARRSSPTGSRCRGWSPRPAQLPATLAAHTGDLGGAVTNTAPDAAPGRQRSARRSQDSLTRAPAVLAQAAASWPTSTTPSAAQPGSDRAAAGRAAARDAAATGRPVRAGPRPDDRPRSRRCSRPRGGASARFRRSSASGVPALKSLDRGAGEASPRSCPACGPYAPDLVAGFFNGVGGAAGGGYDANGHYLQVAAAVQGGGASLTGLLSLLGSDAEARAAERRAHRPARPVPGRRRPAVGRRLAPVDDARRRRAPGSSATRPTISSHETARR